MGGSSDLSLKIVLSAQDQASGALKGFGSTLVNLAGDAGPLLGGMLAISAAAIGVGVASVQMAAQYQTQMNMVAALTGASQSQMAAYDSQLKQLAMNAGVAPAELAKGLYNVLSAGYQGAQAMQVLTLATEDAKIGLTDAKTTTNALTVALKAFNVPASQFNAVNGEMLRTVTAGKMSMQDYASAISKTSSVAVQYKDNMSDMNAVLATLTSSGIKNANVAGTDYNNLLKVLNGNTTAVAKASHAINPAFNQNAFAAMNVHDKVMYLNSMIVQHGHNISEVIGKQQNAAAAFTMLATHSGVYTQNLKNLSDQQKNAKATGDAWAVTQSGFNQQLSRAQASVQVLFIDIGQKLLPVLTKIVGAVAPAVTWLINFAKATSQNQVAMALIKGALVGFVALLLMILVPAFITWATAAGAAAIATLAATWPLILIAAIIAVVVAAIILAVQHWGQIVKWLQGVWGGIVKFFQNIWNGILLGLRIVGQFFANVWNGIKTGVSNFLSALGNIVKIGFQLVVDYFELPFRIIGFLFNWLYQHNVYFQRLVDAIKRIISAGIAFLQRVWKNIVNELVGLWQSLSGFATTAWNKLVKAIQIAWALVVGVVTGVWQKISSVFTGAWNTYIAKPVATLWSNVSSAFGNAWHAISQKLSDLWNSISGWFANLAKTAIQWGVNLIQGFINGITNMAGKVGNAVSGIAGKVGSFLGFHSPAKEGPGSEADVWGPNLVKMYAASIAAGKPQIQAALNTMVSPMVAMSRPQSYGAIPYGQPPLQGNSSSNYGGGNHYGNNTFVIQGAGQNPDAIAKAVEDRLNRKYRRSGVMTNPAVGARSS